LAPNEGYAGLHAAVEAAYQVGSRVVDEIVGQWPTYRDHIP
jgi:purine nucleoside permease